MKIYCAHASSFDFEKYFYNPFTESKDLKDNQFIFPHFEKQITKDSKPVIQSCDLLLAEVSYPSTGMGIELGWGILFNVPIIAVHKHDIKPTDSLKMITEDIYSYASSQELVDCLKNYLKAQRAKQRKE